MNFKSLLVKIKDPETAITTTVSIANSFDCSIDKVQGMKMAFIMAERYVQGADASGVHISCLLVSTDRSRSAMI